MFVFGRELAATNPAAFGPVKWAGATAAAASLAALVVLFVLAGNPARLREMLERLERVLPSQLVGLVARVAEKFATGLRRRAAPEPVAGGVGPVVSALAARSRLGIWAVAVAFHLPVPFTGSFLHHGAPRDWRGRADAGGGRRLSLGVSLRGHDVLRGGRGGRGRRRDRAARASRSDRPCSLGLFFAAQEGLNVAGMRQLAEQAERRADSLTP